jgi:hypothetical protein
MDPWVEHVKKNPKCFHVRLAKGIEFIKDVQCKMLERKLDESVSNVEENNPTTPDDDDDVDDGELDDDDNNEGLVIF